MLLESDNLRGRQSIERRGPEPNCLGTQANCTVDGKRPFAPEFRSLTPATTHRRITASSRPARIQRPSSRRLRGALPDPSDRLRLPGEPTVITLNVNGQTHTVDVPADTPLLWVLRDTLGMTGTKFGCGQALCGACTVHLNGAATRSCTTPVAAVAGSKITTIEGLAAHADHPVQRAWLQHDVPQCGYCQSGQIMSAAALLAQNKAADATPTSTRRWAATSAAVAPTAISAPPSIRAAGLMRKGG